MGGWVDGWMGGNLNFHRFSLISIDCHFFYWFSWIWEASKARGVAGLEPPWTLYYTGVLPPIDKYCSYLGGLWMGGWVDGYVDGWMGGWMGGWVDTGKSHTLSLGELGGYSILR